MQTSSTHQASQPGQDTTTDRSVKEAVKTAASPDSQGSTSPDSPLQVHVDELNIDDDNPSTEGGAPAWMAFGIVVGISLVVGPIVVMILALTMFD